MASDVIQSLETKELRTDKFGLGVTPTAKQVDFTITNWTNDIDMDCDASADAVLADVLATLIKELQAKGIIGGTTSA